MVKKFDLITFRGKFVEEVFQIDRDLPPNGGERTDFLNDCFAEWDYWETMTRKKLEKEKEGEKE